MKRLLNLLLIVTMMILSSVSIVSAAPTLKLTPEGIGVLTFGSKIQDLPASQDGMYDRFESIYDDFNGATTHYFYLGDVLKYEVTWDDEILNIQIYDTNVDLGGYSVGDPMSKILAMNPLQEITNDGLSLSLNGCNLGLGELTQSGNTKFDEAYANLKKVTLEPSDFTESATLSYAIATKGYESLAAQSGVQNSTDNTQAIAQGDSSLNLSESIIEICVAIFFILAYIGIGFHMFKIKQNDDCDRVFTGSYWRMFLFYMLTSGPIWMGEWVLVIFGNCILIPAILAVYYYSCKTPMAVIRKRGFVRNSSAWNSMWNNVTNHKANNAYISSLTRDYNDQVDRYNYAPSEVSQEQLDQMRYNLNDINAKIQEEKTGTEKSIMALMIFLFSGILYVYLTPISIIFSYLKNYVYYNRKRIEKMENRR